MHLVGWRWTEDYVTNSISSWRMRRRRGQRVQRHCRPNPDSDLRFSCKFSLWALNIHTTNITSITAPRGKECCWFPVSAVTPSRFTSLCGRQSDAGVFINTLYTASQFREVSSAYWDWKTMMHQSTWLVFKLQNWKKMYWHSFLYEWNQINLHCMQNNNNNKLHFTSSLSCFLIYLSNKSGIVY